MAKLFNVSIMESTLMKNTNEIAQLSDDFTDYLDSPLGLIECKASSKGITQVIFCGDKKGVIKGNEITDSCLQQLIEYFAGSRKYFDLPLNPKGTDFQKSVWDCLGHIPFGETRSYGNLAEQLNNPKAVRAVGGANGRNPISLIVPCHRVIGANGSLTGYAGGIERKLWLLKHEGIELKLSEIDDHRDLQHVIDSRQDKTQYLL